MEENNFYHYQKICFELIEIFASFKIISTTILLKNQENMNNTQLSFEKI